MGTFAEACGVGRGKSRAIIVDFQRHPLGVILGAHVDLTALGRVAQDVVEEVLRQDAKQPVTKVVADV